MRSDHDRLLDMLDAIAAIRSRVRDKQGFDSDEMLRVWCLHHITIIGEAAGRISSELCSKYPGIPWRDMIGMRNAVVHGYFSVDWEEVWAVVDRDIEPLRTAIEDILQKETA